MIVKKGDWITPLRDFDGCDISAGQPILVDVVGPQTERIGGELCSTYVRFKNCSGDWNATSTDFERFEPISPEEARIAKPLPDPSEALEFIRRKP